MADGEDKTISRSGTLVIHGATRGPVAAFCEAAIEGVSLAEDLLTVKYLDEDTHEPFFLGLVFIGVQLSSIWVGSIVECAPFKTPVFLWNVGREALQCYLYILFSSWDDDAVMWMSILGGTQVGLYLVIWIIDMFSEADKLDAGERAGMACGGCYLMTFLVLIFGGTTIIFLVFQEESPFRSKMFESMVAAYIWMFTFITTDALKQAKHMYLNAKAAEGAEKSRIDNPCAAGVSACFSITMGVLGFLAIMAFSIYQYVLAWEWWFDPAIEKTFDKVYSMIMIVAQTVTLATLCCSCVCGCCVAMAGAAGAAAGN